MLFHRISFLSIPLALALAAIAPAQTTKPTTQPTPSNDVGPAPSPVDLATEETGVQETPEDRVKKLQEELKSVQSELEHLQKIQKRGGMVGRVRQILAGRTQEVREFAPATPAAPTTGAIRMFHDEELASLPADVMFTVNGRPVKQSEFDLLAKVMSSYMTDDLDDVRREAMMALVLKAAAYAENPDVSEANRGRLQQVVNRVREHSPFDEECKAISEGPAAESGGKFGPVAAGDLDPLLAMSIMSMEAGDSTPALVESTLGFHYVECTGRTGTDLKTMKFTGRQIMVHYAPSTPEAHDRVRNGVFELAFRNAEDMRFAPKAGN